MIYSYNTFTSLKSVKDLWLRSMKLRIASLLGSKTLRSKRYMSWYNDIATARFKPALKSVKMLMKK